MIKRFFHTIWFVLLTGHFPETYRRLFRDISTLYLTPDSPGQTEIYGIPISCLTHGLYLQITIRQSKYYIDRSRLTVKVPPHMTDAEAMGLEDLSLKALRAVFNHMLTEGIPFQMSETQVTELGI